MELRIEMFESILGNEDIKQILKKTIENNTTLHSYMFVRDTRYRKKDAGYRIF